MSQDEKSVRVVVAMDFSDAVLARLREISPRLHIERHFPEVPDSVWPETEVLYTLRHFPQPQQAPRLRWIQMHFAGVGSNADRPIFKAEDVEITTGSGIHAVQMSEYCLGMMLAFHYQIPRMLADKAASRWPERQYDIYQPHGLRGLTLGIVGYGTIGRELARLAAALGMTVLATKRDLKRLAEHDEYRLDGTGDPTGDIPERFYPPEAVATMARDCDFLVVTAPLTPATRHMINADVFEAMPRHAILINVGRGPVVDEAALVSALAAQKIGGAALDVFEEEPLPSGSPLWNLDNVIISPHVSGNTSQYHHKAAEVFAANLRRYLENKPLLNRYQREHGY